VTTAFDTTATLFFASAVAEEDLQLARATMVIALVDPLGPSTRVDLTDGAPQDWELGVPFLPGMDEVRVETARLDLRALRARVVAEGWTAVPQAQGWRIALARPARLVAIAFDPPEPQPPLAAGQILRLLLSPADPPGPPAFVDPPFPLGPAYRALPQRLSQRSHAGLTVAEVDPTQGSSWLLQWAVGDDATELAPVGVRTTIRSVTVEPAVADVRLELRPEDPGGEPVLVWNHPGLLEPTSGLQPVDLSPIARKRLGDRLAAANTAATRPSGLTLPVRLVAASGGPIGVSGTDLRVDYAVAAVGGGAALALRGDPQPLALTVPTALRPDRGALSLTARHLGRELNGPVGPVAATGGPGRLVTVGRWAAVALAVEPHGQSAEVTLAAVTLDVAVDAPAEVAVDVRADVHGIPGKILGSAVVRLTPGPRALRELLLDPQPTVLAGGVVWVAARATTGTVRWYDDLLRDAVLPLVAGPASRTTVDGGLTWAPDESLLGEPTVPRARLLHRVDPPYAPPSLTLRIGSRELGELVLAPTGAALDEFAASGVALPSPLADLAGRTTGDTRSHLTVHVAARAALDVRVAEIDLVYLPTAGPTRS
jgi:hypothetical protein